MTKRLPPTQAQAMQLARQLKEHLRQSSIPVEQMYLFGSIAKEEAHAWSDIDIAIIHRPFGPSRLQERIAIRKARRPIDLRIETVCLHPEDMQNRFSPIAQEVKQHGIPV
jgi:predicted nucleotidyltransferase